MVLDMIGFIDNPRVTHGAELIYKLLPIAPFTYHAHLAKHADPSLLSARARQDLALREEIC